MTRIANRFHKGSDGWGRGSYEVPGAAVLGASDTGTSPDSPAHSDRVAEELERFRGDLLRETGVRTRMNRYTRSGNLFMVKRWVTVVDANDWPRAAEYALRWLRDHKFDTLYVHDADQEQAGVAPPQPTKEEVHT